MPAEYFEKIADPGTRADARVRRHQAYLALNAPETRLPDEDAYAEVVNHCDLWRYAAEARILDGLPTGSVPDEAQADSSSRRELAGNPRRLKRFLNAYWIRLTVRTVTGLSLTTPRSQG